MVKNKFDLSADFSLAMKNLGVAKAAPIAVACSGGPDSMALTLLLADWAKKNSSALIAITVDHGLRKEAKAEALQVGAWLKKKHIAHIILTWQSKKPAKNTQETARKARYQLLSDYCHKHGIAYLFVAHTEEDQAETFLLRLARGSGVDGLSAMSTKTQLYGITLCRPLLGITKAKLIAYLKTHKQKFCSDPSNENTDYDRIKIRKLMPSLQTVGLDAKRLVKTAASMRRARTFLEQATTGFIHRECSFFPEKYALLKSLPEHEEIVLRVLAKLIMDISGSEIKPRLTDLERLYHHIAAPDFKTTTLCGCVFAWHKNQMLIYRELNAVAPAVNISEGETVIWDNRFTVHLEKASSKLTLSALGQEGWLTIAKKHKLCNPYPTKHILYALPALRDKKEVVAIPHLGFSAKDVDCQAID